MATDIQKAIAEADRKISFVIAIQLDMDASQEECNKARDEAHAAIRNVARVAQERMRERATQKALNVGAVDIIAMKGGFGSESAVNSTQEIYNAIRALAIEEVDGE